MRKIHFLIFICLFLKGNLIVGIPTTVKDGIASLDLNSTDTLTATPSPLTDGAGAFAPSNATLNQTEATGGPRLPQTENHAIGSGDEKRVVPTTLFHTTFRIVCATPSEILRMPRDPNLYPRFLRREGHGQVRQQSRPNYDEYDTFTKPGERRVYQVRIHTWLRQFCRNCKCDENTGEIIHSIPLPGVVYKGTEPSYRCRSGDELPQLCKSWFNCKCDIEALQPEPVSSETLQAHYDALGQLPQFFRDRFPNYVWNPPSGTLPNGVTPPWAPQQPAPPVVPEDEFERLNTLADIAAGSERVVPPGGLERLGTLALFAGVDDAPGASQPDPPEGAMERMDTLADFAGYLEMDKYWDHRPPGAGFFGGGFDGGGSGGSSSGVAKKREIPSPNEPPKSDGSPAIDSEKTNHRLN
ncbi:hypothetical protein TWF481_009109 [Arthrobotrys musiformis]|uniref:Uncharacterized protein n=1 Tax=Arthrobotrys musiformis TaxID=47236 RepID=A0AAV9W5C9_9PEZI